MKRVPWRNRSCSILSKRTSQTISGRISCHGGSLPCDQREPPSGVRPQSWSMCWSQGKDLPDRKSTRLNSSHVEISYAVFCLKKKNISHTIHYRATTNTIHTLCVASRNRTLLATDTAYLGLSIASAGDSVALLSPIRPMTAFS